jgi:hypothetical protein
MDKNRGYWKVADEYYTNKVLAIMAAQYRNLEPTDITYHYNDPWWDSACWDQEPSESLNELYVRRAKQLREKYKTLILRYSGGADSHNILKIFVDNNIKIDVIAMGGWTPPGVDPRLFLANVEKELLAIPQLKMFEKQGIKFDHVILNDFSPTINVIGDHPEWIFDIDSPRFNLPDITAGRALTTPEFHVWDDPSTGVILGIDKPRVDYKMKKIWYFSQPDYLHTMHPQANNMTSEPFYWTADMPEIVIKQSHVVKNFFKKNQDIPSSNLKSKSVLIPLIYPDTYKNLDPRAKDLPYWDHEPWNSKFCNDKRLGPKGTSYDWGFHHSPYYKIWKDGIDLADRLIDQKFKNNQSIWDDGLKPIFSKPRWLGR